MKEYVGCRIERTKDYIRLTQPVKVQRLIDEFNYTREKARLTPARPGSVFTVDVYSMMKEYLKGSRKDIEASQVCSNTW
jgi:hypothetical protein